MDLVNAGEKSLGKTLTLDGRVFAPTFTPSNLIEDLDVCKPESGTGLLRVIDLYNGDSDVINYGKIIPDTPSLHFDDGQVRLLLPPGTPEGSLDEPGDLNCKGGVCTTGETLRPYANYWFQEDY